MLCIQRNVVYNTAEMANLLGKEGLEKLVILTKAMDLFHTIKNWKMKITDEFKV